MKHFTRGHTRGQALDQDGYHTILLESPAVFLHTPILT